MSCDARHGFVALLLGALSLAAVAAEPPPTLRVDYFHSGNALEERYALERVLIEPLPWPGNPARADRRHQSRHEPIRGRRSEIGCSAVFARLQHDLRRVAHDR